MIDKTKLTKVKDDARGFLYVLPHSWSEPTHPNYTEALELVKNGEAAFSVPSPKVSLQAKNLQVKYKSQDHMRFGSKRGSYKRRK